MSFSPHPIRRRLTALAAAATLLATAACGDGGSEAGADSPVTVQIAADAFVLGAQAWVANGEGYFEEEGLDVEIQTYQTGIESLQSVVGGQADFTTAIDFATLSGLTDGVRVLGSVAAPDPGFHKLAVASDISAPEDLVGKKIGFVPATSEAFVTVEYLRLNGIAEEDVELVSMPGLFDLVGALKTGDVQAGWVWANGVEEVEADDDLSILTDDSEVLDVVSTFAIANTTFMDEHPEAVEAILRAYAKASEFIDENPEAAGQIIADGVSGDADVLAGLLPMQNYGLGLSQAQVDQLNRLHEHLVQTGALEASEPIATYFDLTAMEEIVPETMEARP